MIRQKQLLILFFVKLLNQQWQQRWKFRRELNKRVVYFIYVVGGRLFAIICSIFDSLGSIFLRLSRRINKWSNVSVKFCTMSIKQKEKEKKSTIIIHLVIVILKERTRIIFRHLCIYETLIEINNEFSCHSQIWR